MPAPSAPARSIACSARVTDCWGVSGKRMLASAIRNMLIWGILGFQHPDQIRNFLDAVLRAPALQAIDNLLRRAWVPEIGSADLDSSRAGQHEFNHVFRARD